MTCMPPTSDAHHYQRATPEDLVLVFLDPDLEGELLQLVQQVYALSLHSSVKDACLFKIECARSSLAQPTRAAKLKAGSLLPLAVAMPWKQETRKPGGLLFSAFG